MFGANKRVMRRLRPSTYSNINMVHDPSGFKVDISYFMKRTFGISRAACGKHVGAHCLIVNTLQQQLSGIASLSDLLSRLSSPAGFSKITHSSFSSGTTSLKLEPGCLHADLLTYFTLSKSGFPDASTPEQLKMRNHCVGTSINGLVEADWILDRINHMAMMIGRVNSKEILKRELSSQEAEVIEGTIFEVDGEVEFPITKGVFDAFMREIADYVCRYILIMESLPFTRIPYMAEEIQGGGSRGERISDLLNYLADSSTASGSSQTPFMIYARLFDESGIGPVVRVFLRENKTSGIDAFVAFQLLTLLRSIQVFFPDQSVALEYFSKSKHLGSYTGFLPQGKSSWLIGMGIALFTDLNSLIEMKSGRRGEKIPLDRLVAYEEVIKRSLYRLNSTQNAIAARRPTFLTEPFVRGDRAFQLEKLRG